MTRAKQKSQFSYRYSYWPSNLHEVTVPPYQEDPYESKYVYAEKSQMSEHAGDGLFLKRDVSANTTIAFYNGIRVKPGDTAPYQNTGYQIFVDWNKKSVSYRNKLCDCRLPACNLMGSCGQSIQTTDITFLACRTKNILLSKSFDICLA